MIKQSCDISPLSLLQNNISKKELLDISREKDKLYSNIGGIKDLNGKPDLVVIDYVINIETNKIYYPLDHWLFRIWSWHDIKIYNTHPLLCHSPCISPDSDII